MSANDYPIFFNSQTLGDTLGTVYTVPAQPTNQILQELQLKFTNLTNAAKTITVHAIPSGGTASDTNAQAKGMAVPANDYIILPIERLGAGGFIQALADTAASVSVQPIGGKLHTP